MSTSDDAFIAEAKSLDYTFLAKPGNKQTWTPRYGYLTHTWGYDPRFKIGGSFHGWFYGVVGSGGYALENGNRSGPAVNGYSDFAGVLGTGVYVTGVAGTSINSPGVYGQTGEDSLIPPDVQAGVLGVSNTSQGVGGVSISDRGIAGYSWDSAGVWGASENGIGVSG